MSIFAVDYSLPLWSILYKGVESCWWFGANPLFPIQLKRRGFYQESGKIQQRGDKSRRIANGYWVLNLFLMKWYVFVFIGNSPSLKQMNTEHGVLQEFPGILTFLGSRPVIVLEKWVLSAWFTLARWMQIQVTSPCFTRKYDYFFITFIIRYLLHVFFKLSCTF